MVPPVVTLHQIYHENTVIHSYLAYSVSSVTQVEILCLTCVDVHKFATEKYNFVYVQ